MLPPDHDAFAFQALVDGLDLAGFEAAYRADGQGRPPYSPKVMLALVLYCRSKHLVSARQVAAACQDDLGAQLITGNRRPHRSTIDRFLAVHGKAVKALLAQTLRIGHAEDLVDVSVVAGDGTYVQANAAMGATVNATELAEQISVLEQQLAAATAAWAEQATAVDASAGLFDLAEPVGGRPAPADRHRAAWRKVCTLSNLVRSRQETLAFLRSRPDNEHTEWQQRLERDQQRVTSCQQRVEATRATLQAAADKRAAAEAAGAKIPGTRPVPVEQHAHLRQARTALATATARAATTAATPPTGARVNTTDPTSAIMLAKNGGFDQLHNVQALAGRRQFIIAIGTHPCANDKQALVNLLHAGRANLDAAGVTDPIGVALFDAGYASQTNFTATLPCNLLLTAVQKEAHQTGRATGDPHAVASWQAMADRLNEPENSKLYKRRAAIIEPLFAQLFTQFGRNINARGEQVDVELHLWAITHNLNKIIRHRRHKDRPG